MGATDFHGRTAAEREQQRQRYIDKAVQQAQLKGLSMRCQYEAGLADPREAQAQHAMCRGESPPSGGGCLCRGHDPVAEIIAG